MTSDSLKSAVNTHQKSLLTHTSLPALRLKDTLPHLKSVRLTSVLPQPFQMLLSIHLRVRHCNESLLTFQPSTAFPVHIPRSRGQIALPLNAATISESTTLPIWHDVWPRQAPKSMFTATMPRGTLEPQLNLLLETQVNRYIP